MLQSSIEYFTKVLIIADDINDQRIVRSAFMNLVTDQANMRTFFIFSKAGRKFATKLTTRTTIAIANYSIDPCLSGYKYALTPKAMRVNVNTTINIFY